MYVPWNHGPALERPALHAPKPFLIQLYHSRSSAMLSFSVAGGRWVRGGGLGGGGLGGVSEVRGRNTDIGYGIVVWHAVARNSALSFSAVGAK